MPIKSPKEISDMVEKAKKERVYCCNCKCLHGYYKDCENGVFYNFYQACVAIAKKEVRKAFDTALQHYPAKIVEHKVKDYVIQNKYNDCKYYKRIWFKFWV